MGCCSNEKECGCETKSKARGKFSLLGAVFVVLVILVAFNWQ